MWRAACLVAAPRRRWGRFCRAFVAALARTRQKEDPHREHQAGNGESKEHDLLRLRRDGGDRQGCGRELL